MLVLYQGSGSGSFSLCGGSCSWEELSRLKHNAVLVLRARREETAANYLESIPFEIRDAFNDFNDEFSVLYASVPLAQYEELRNLSAEHKHIFAQIAATISEIGPFIRFVTAELALAEVSPDSNGSERRLTKSEVQKVVYKYIGVEGGYLSDFTYRSHREFYIELNLDINPDQYEGTTRQRFTTILLQSPVEIQARILEGVLLRYPIDSSPLRSQEHHNEIRGWIKRLDGRSGAIEAPSLRITNEVVRLALADAEKLLKSSTATSAVDRVHTALHGYILAVCKDAGIKDRNESSLTAMFKALRSTHPAFRLSGRQGSEAGRLMMALATIIDSVNALRNNNSIAHPSPELLDSPEAMLAINTAHTILRYIDEILERAAADPP